MANTIICIFLQSSLIVSFHMKMSICVQTPNIEQQVELNLNANKIYLIQKLINRQTNWLIKQHIQTPAVWYNQEIYQQHLNWS